MSFGGELPHNAALLHDDRVQKIEQLLADITSEKWCQKRWHRGNRRCLGQMILDAYSCSEQSALPTLPIAAPILQAAWEVTGYPFDTVMHFNDSDKTDAELVRTVLEQTRANLLHTTPRILPPLPSASAQRRRMAVDIFEILGAVGAFLFPYYWYGAF